MKNFFKNTIFYLYTFISTFFENFFYKKKIYKKNELQLKGFSKLKLIKKINFKKYIKEKVRGPNNYLNKFIIKKNNIEDFLKDIFITNQLAYTISNLTGFKYCVDFFVAYETIHIPHSLSHRQIYANHWHRDKPFSKNTLKIIIPITSIDKHLGGIEILNKECSSFFLKTKKDDEILIEKNFSYYKMIADNNEYLVFLPNLCLHRAGNPKKNYSRSQLMLQLNPSNSWSFKNNLYDLQYRQEPKFPLLNVFRAKSFLK